MSPGTVTATVFLILIYSNKEKQYSSRGRQKTDRYGSDHACWTKDQAWIEETMVTEKGPMGRSKKKEGTLRGSQKPSWIGDKENQRKWNGQFLRILRRDYADSDNTVAAILCHKRLAESCATRVRSYVDKRVALCLNKQSKARGIKHKKQLEIAIAGLREASSLLTKRGNQGLAASLGVLADGLSGELGRCKQAFGTKRRGRDRDHSILYECHSFLESELGHRVTNKTLANLVSAGYETDGNRVKQYITEEEIRKNLAHFKSKNPLWRNFLDPRLWQLVSDQVTK